MTPAVLVSRSMKEADLGSTLDALEYWVVIPAPEATKNAPFTITSPSVLQFHPDQSPSSVSTRFVTCPYAKETHRVDCHSCVLRDCLVQEYILPRWNAKQWRLALLPKQIWLLTEKCTVQLWKHMGVTFYKHYYVLALSANKKSIFTCSVESYVCTDYVYIQNYN